MSETWFPTDMAAEYLGVSDTAIRSWCKSGKLNARKGHRNEWRIPLSRLSEIKAEREQLKKEVGPVSIEELIALYEKLGSLLAVSKVAKQHQSTISARLKEAGYKIKTEGHPRKKKVSGAATTEHFYDMAAIFAERGLVLKAGDLRNLQKNTLT